MIGSGRDDPWIAQQTGVTTERSNVVGAKESGLRGSFAPNSASATEGRGQRAERKEQRAKSSKGRRA